MQTVAERKFQLGSIVASVFGVAQLVERHGLKIPWPEYPFLLA